MMRKFTIPKGIHISHIFPRFHSGKACLTFTARFSRSCLYDLNNDNNLDVNKLYGLGFGFNHHIQSFRLGWNCQSKNGKIQIFAYYYNDGVRKMQYICDMDVDKDYDCYIYFDRTGNKVFVDITKDELNSHTSYDFRFKDCKHWGFYLFPYFGGDEMSPRRMSIYINNK